MIPENIVDRVAKSVSGEMASHLDTLLVVRDGESVSPLHAIKSNPGHPSVESMRVAVRKLGLIEEDHRAIKRRVKAKQGFREFHAARRTIQGYEAIHMIRKGQARWVSGSDVRRQIQFINKLFGVAALRRRPVGPTNRSPAAF